ncbi:hypothetical protein DOY81_011986 [Sarcophaga bullata]|nr:hypothetical protein DOY81_011986 [Sarcophaga bullata]
MLPFAFELARFQLLAGPKFDSAVLEGQFQTSVFPHVRMRYRSQKRKLIYTPLTVAHHHHFVGQSHQN